MSSLRGLIRLYPVRQTSRSSLNILHSVIYTLTQELGWRGYLYHLWRRYGFSHSLAVGLIWGLWQLEAASWDSHGRLVGNAHPTSNFYRGRVNPRVASRNSVTACLINDVTSSALIRSTERRVALA
jgi:membrane protease YdiL (CAAX protease family)